MQKLEKILPFQMAPGKTTTCQFCGTELGFYLCPDSRHSGQFFEIKQPCRCSDAQQVIAATQAANIRESERKRFGDELAWKLANCGVEQRFRRAKTHSVFSQFVISSALEIGGGLFITGHRGCGKTYSTSAVVLEVIRKGHDARFVRSIDILNAIKHSYGTPENEREIVARFTAPDLLAIDDLGKEQVTEWSLSKLYEIIDKRYAQLRSTIVNTQYGNADLIDMWTINGDRNTADAIIRRLAETCLEVDMNKIKRPSGNQQ